MAPDEFVDFVIVQKSRSGMSLEQVNMWFDALIQKSDQIPSVSKQAWVNNKANIQSGGSFLPVFSDAKTLAVLAYEMKKGGDIFATYKINTYSGQSYVVLKGYAGLRNQLSGTRYLVNSPKVVTLGIGKLGSASAIRGGLVISIVFSVAFHGLNQLMNDRATWHDFVAGVAVDVVSAVTGAAIAWGAVSAVVGATAMVAIGPIALVVVVGAGITLVLNSVSQHYGLTEKIARMLWEFEARMRSNVRHIKNDWRQGLNYADEDPVGFMHKLFGIPYFGR
jgi:hypothetical protein